MYKQALKGWIWSGVDQGSLDNITPYRLTNIVTLIVIAVLALQLPFAMAYFSEGGDFKCYLLVTHILCLLTIPALNRLGYHQIASASLVLLYTSYIVISSVHWQQNLNIQYFLILAVVIVPFLFSEQREWSLHLCSTLLCGGFVALDVWLVLQNGDLTAMTDYQQTIRVSNSIFFVLAAILCATHIRRNTHNSWMKLARERKRSESLLLNILPSSIAERLKGSNTLVADYFEQASILFADIQGFTQITKRLSPHQLVNLLNEVFTTFDTVTQKYGMEKIKTMGDEYMAVAGVPNHNRDHAVRCCQCAKEMREVFEQICAKHNLISGLRIGIGSGEVVAGVIGKNKFSYDLWGDAVNMASRMESQGQTRRIQVTESTYQLAKDTFIFTKRGQLQMKGIGNVSTYWLE